MNDNQNAFVTRSTSRVLSVPGGKSSVGFLFGGGTTSKAPAPAAAEKTAETEKEVLATEEVAVVEEEKEGTTDLKATTDTTNDDVAPVNDAMSEAARIKKKNESQHFSIFGTVKNDTQAPKESSNAFASAATTNSYNVLTDRPTSRVLRPPGGQSSIKLG